uniref:NADH-ubiquinone oxidoreductase chain 2 n=2 Tax=Eremoneura TaxID=480118 RepID=A0A8A5M2E3_9DIOP|nr:NADH dehydrogenase subunit 2 [Nothybus sumatranus]QQV73778.1 NADH dehydrogenase subunit 2 [Syneches medoganus]QTF87877.1 NADH dehydrogenase subunit 2 [Nothybus sumatranus]
MNNNSSKVLFYLILMMSTLITISSNSWLSAWMGLEINLLSFIPLMSDNQLMSTESSLKYFLTQALASMVLMFAVIIIMLNNLMFIIKQDFVEMILMSSLLMKTGAAPFHFWFPIVTEGLSWTNAFILMTWQKIAPLILISYLMNSDFMILASILSVIVGSLGGLNQTSLRKIMAFSSINHLGWILSSLLINENMFLGYFIMYSFLSFNLIMLFNKFSLTHINQLMILFFNSKNLKITLFLNFLSLGGLPPFLGFFPKWLVIQALTFNNQMLLTTILIVMTMITLFYYLRLSYSAFLLNTSENNWIYSFKMNKTFYFIYLHFSFFSIFGLFIISSYFSLI